MTNTNGRAGSSGSSKLEFQLQRELDGSRRAGNRDLPELSIHLLTRRIEPGGPIQALELGVVERIEEFAAELQAATLAPDGELFHQAQVPVVDARTSVWANGGVSGVSSRRAGKGGGVEPAAEAGGSDGDG